MRERLRWLLAGDSAHTKANVCHRKGVLRIHRATGLAIFQRFPYKLNHFEGIGVKGLDFQNLYQQAIQPTIF